MGWFSWMLFDWVRGGGITKFVTLLLQRGVLGCFLSVKCYKGVLGWFSSMLSVTGGVWGELLILLLLLHYVTLLLLRYIMQCNSIHSM